MSHETELPVSEPPPNGHTPDDLELLSALGYDGPWPALLNSLCSTGLHGRVVRSDRGAATVQTGVGLRRSVWSPATSPPVTGDWVVLSHDTSAGTSAGEEPLQLLATAPRATTMSRPPPAGSPYGDQVLAANMDMVGVVTPVDADLNIRRLERGIVMAYESGATPLVLLTKTDLAEDLDQAIRQAEAAAIGVDVLPLAPTTGDGIDALRHRLGSNQTMALLGASGAGKSTLANALVGRVALAVGDVREVDGKGRHTTTHRELVPLPTGGAVLDTPGLRTLGLGQVQEGMAQAFPDIEGLTGGCRFGDCRHETEPGCAVLEALDANSLDPERLEGWRRIRAASESAALRADTAAFRKEARSWGRVYREAQAVKKRGDRA